MDIRIFPSCLNGSVRAIASKSDAHRLLICAAMADNPTDIYVPESSEDIDATVRCLRAMGAGIERGKGLFRVTPLKKVSGGFPLLDCGESGSLLRFILPVTASLSDSASFDGHGRLPDRPIGELVSAMEEHGVSFSGRRLPFEISGRLRGGDFTIPGNISSQYITGLLLALPNTPEGGMIHLTTPLESASYVDMTLYSLRRFGVDVMSTPDGWYVPGGQKFTSPGVARADGDWSNAAFFLTAGALCGEVTVSGLDTGSYQGDREICQILSRFGAEVSVSGDRVTVKKSPLHAIREDVRNIPDLLPILAVSACCAGGRSVFTGGARLRIKESDRLGTVCSMINSLGGEASETNDGITVSGKSLSGGTVSGSGDHRIVMASAIAACACSSPVTITGAEAAGKSYPGFFEDFKKLGGNCCVLDIRQQT